MQGKREDLAHKGRYSGNGAFCPDDGCLILRMARLAGEPDKVDIMSRNNPTDKPSYRPKAVLIRAIPFGAVLVSAV